MASEQDLIGALRRADAAGDTGGAHRIAAMIQQGRQPQGSDKGSVVSGVHGALDAATFGLFDKAAPYVGAALTGESVDQARGELTRNEQATTDAHPIAHIAGELGGAVAGGGALEHAGLTIASKLMPGAVDAARASLALQKGETARNVGRLMAQGAASGAAYGAVSGAVQGSDNGVGGAAAGAVYGGTLGAAGGAVLGPTGALAAKGVSVVRRAFGDTGSKAIGALAKKFGMSADDLASAYKNYEADAGHPPSLAEIADLQSRGELQVLARRNPGVGAAVETARAKAAGDLPGYMSQQTASTLGHPQDVADLVTAREKAADAAMTPIRGQLLGLSPDETDLMISEVMPHSGIKGPVRREIAGQLNQGTLSLGNADVIRRNLNRQAFAKPGEGYDQLGDALNTVARSASPEYGQMLDQYAAHSRYIDAFQHGAAGKTVGQTSDPALIKGLATPEGQQGYQAGLATSIHDRAFKNEAGAVRTADELSQSAAMVDNAVRTFGGGKTADLAMAAKAKSKGLENLSVISPGTPRPPGDSNVSALHAGLAAVSGVKGMMYHALQAATHGLKLAPAVQAKLGDMLTNPRQSQQAIAYLRAQGAKDHDLRVLLTQAARATARPAGLAGAYAQGQFR